MSATRRRTVQKNVYFSAVEWDRILRRMRTNDITNFSQYARDVLSTGRVEVVYRPESDQALLGQIGRVGNNINQIARWANTERHLTGDMALEALDLLREIRRLVAEDKAGSIHGDHQDFAGEDDPQSGD
ncbi:MobC family plasmid mobilization relaxosome protein [Trueperella pyogenes]|uniref:MobC family plasmid mobilization relaxosome protein n=1 Tax=Trueperella pyogenes TaxID=1661 RepID=UPI0024BF7268|nr:MobC family plasmid mobilization relaxosome protein [Trueperella pyogenes]WHU60650.1 MobC family plasmid mobilization relaxosome protein [Trueperella pyogenes]